MGAQSARAALDLEMPSCLTVPGSWDPAKPYTFSPLANLPRLILGRNCSFIPLFGLLAVNGPDTVARGCPEEPPPSSSRLIFFLIKMSSIMKTSSKQRKSNDGTWKEMGRGVASCLQGA